MGRPRKKDTHLPPCVYRRHGAYWFVKNNAWQRLGSDLGRALAEYARRFETPGAGMPALIEQAFPAITGKVKPNTRAQYRIAANKLKHMLAEFSPEQVQQRHVAQIKLAMAETPNMANRCLSVLRLVFDYAVEQQLLDNNPAIGIKRHAEAKRERLISLAEYQAIYLHASPRLQVVMDLLYLTGQRVTDVLTIRVADIFDDGIYFKQGKTGARLAVRWTLELRAVVERAKELHGNLRALSLLHNRRGKPPDYRTVRDQWKAACATAGVLDADLRDLRAMSGTAAEDQGKDPTALLGHTSRLMTERYLRGKQIPVVDGPSFRQVSNIGQKETTKQ
jgi:integrase